MNEIELSFDDQLRQAIGEVTMKLFDKLESDPPSENIQNLEISNIAIAVTLHGDLEDMSSVTYIRYEFQKKHLDEQMGLVGLLHKDIVLD